ncbi:MAG: lycopene cyclase domain-containing protein, partial [Chitinophagia bacterium]|nr:lycopene cyclase domain-containing protein [Chitinophagia bacterium]
LVQQRLAVKQRHDGQQHGFNGLAPGPLVSAPTVQNAHAHSSVFVHIGVAALSVKLFETGITHLPQLYTSVTFLFLSVLLAVLVLRKAEYLPHFLLTYLFVLLPFFISNGILTGAITPQPVVAYNNSYNLGIRLHTIPVEDVFYGMLLLLLNTIGFEWLKNKKPAEQTAISLTIDEEVKKK